MMGHWTQIYIQDVGEDGERVGMPRPVHCSRIDRTGRTVDAEGLVVQQAPVTFILPRAVRARAGARIIVIGGQELVIDSVSPYMPPGGAMQPFYEQAQCR